MGKTKILYSRYEKKDVKIVTKHPCGVCKKGVGVN